MADVSGQIRQLKSRIQSLTNYLNGCITRGGAAHGKVRQLKKRLNELESIRKKANGGLTRYSDPVASKERNTARSIRDAVKKHSHTDTIVSTISRAYEPPFQQDSNGWDCISAIDKEIERVRDEIDDAKKEADREDGNANNTRNNIHSLNETLKHLLAQASKG